MQALQVRKLFTGLPYLASPPCERLETVETRSLRFGGGGSGWTGKVEPATMKSFFFCIFLPLFLAGCYQIAQLRKRRMLSHAIHLAPRMHGKLFKVARVNACRSGVCCIGGALLHPFVLSQTRPLPWCVLWWSCHTRSL